MKFTDGKSGVRKVSFFSLIKTLPESVLIPIPFKGLYKK